MSVFCIGTPIGIAIAIGILEGMASLDAVTVALVSGTIAIQLSMVDILLITNVANLTKLILILGKFQRPALIKCYHCRNNSRAKHRFLPLHHIC